MNPLKIQISAPARLHLGFLDLNGGIGRKFGSIGLAISDFETTISGQLADSISVTYTEASLCQRAEKIVANFYRTLGRHIPTAQQGIDLNIISLIPSHAGLGSGTQLSLVIGTLLCRLHAIEASTADIAAQLGRGQRSGIGIATFDHGGFVVDGGLKPDTSVPPILFQQAFPADWQVILIQDPTHKGVHGEQEKSAFMDLPPFSTADAQAICHLTIMQLLPSLVESDLVNFGQALTQIQHTIGDHFAPAQGGRFSSPHVAAVLSHANAQGYNAIAQSSWGPTACVFVANPGSANQLSALLNSFIQNDTSLSHLQVSVVQANHQGAIISQTTV